MKIKTLTTYDVYNYGASLQAYALMTYLSNLGNDVEIINYQPDYLTRKYDYKWVNPESSMSRHVATRVIYRILKFLQRQTTIGRKRAFDQFTRDWLRVTKCRYSSFDELKANPPEADLYIAGSDQIWNVFYEAGRDPAFYLEFVKQGRRASYAASFSYLDIDEGNLKRISDSLHKFTAISVRERHGLELLSQMGLNGTWVLDPVFLLPVTEWECLANIEIPSDKYLLVYDFERNSALQNFARIYAQRKGLKIYSINDTYPLPYADRNFNCAGPREFVGLIRQCAAFVSNSFHGTAFSILFHKPVFVFNRHRHKVNSRMESLLGLFELDDCLINSQECAEKALERKFDYDKIENIKKRELAHSMNFLEKLLS
jgi:hypothetical protein